MTDTLNDKIAAYYEARSAYDEAKKISDDLDKIRRTRESELVSFMIENQIKNVKLDDGTTPTLVNSVSISVTKDNFDAIREWLLDTIGDDADYVEEVVSKPAVLELVKKKLEGGSDPTEMPAFLKCDTRPTLRVSGWKGR
jgi:hypothetical protein